MGAATVQLDGGNPDDTTPPSSSKPHDPPRVDKMYLVASQYYLRE